MNSEKIAQLKHDVLRLKALIKNGEANPEQCKGLIVMLKHKIKLLSKAP